MNAILRVYPESGQSVIVLCNLDSPSASRIGDWLHARMPPKWFHLSYFAAFFLVGFERLVVFFAALASAICANVFSIRRI